MPAKTVVFTKTKKFDGKVTFINIQIIYWDDVSIVYLLWSMIYTNT